MHQFFFSTKPMKYWRMVDFTLTINLLMIMKGISTSTQSANISYSPYLSIG
nr:MAG TPA: hypothetical protein [Caudoviricetes sp.]